MRVQRYTSAAAFLDDAEPFLMATAVENNLILGCAHELASGSQEADAAPYFAAVFDVDRIVMCAFQTLRGRVGVTRASSERALAPLADDILGALDAVRSVHGPDPTAGAFAEMVSRRSSRPARRHSSQRIYEIRGVLPPTAPPAGFLRPAHEAERRLLTEWMSVFFVALREPGDADRLIDQRLRANAMFVWDDNGPVSTASRAGQNPAGERIAHVYTPPELRGRGYASATVAALSQRVLAGGTRYCCLYTDLANPTSNAIYQRLGYQPICDAAMYLFD